MKRCALSVAIPQPLADHLDRVVERCVKQMGTDNKSTVVRWALSIGLRKIEAELDTVETFGPVRLGDG